MKIYMILQVHQLHKQGFSVAAISRKCDISRTTIYKYLAMDMEKSYEWVGKLKTRRRKLDPYKARILSWLKEHPDLSAAQISDWLEEQCQFSDVGESTVRTYVKELRELYVIPKVMSSRSYEALEDSPMGKQIQVDFGEIKVENTEGKKVKLYAIVFILSNARFKYVEWLDRPFTTQDVIRTHEHAFEFFGGRTEEIVYDQDRLMTVSENNGDIILTQAFQSYRDQRGFNFYLCRAADPESKGKVENAVKFVKGHFAKNRRFHNIDAWNESCLKWLARYGNKKKHETTKKRPVEVFAQEKHHLIHVSHQLSFESQHRNIITRTVHKDNIIKYKSNRYSVPLHTYQSGKETKVSVRIEEDQLIIESLSGSEQIAVHPLCHDKGQLIKNSDHQRDRQKSIDQYKETVKKAFKETRVVDLFLDQLSEKYPRYMRDQLQVMSNMIKEYPEHIDEALVKCVNENLYSANAFRDVVKHLAIPMVSPEPPDTDRELDQDKINVSPTTRDLDVYEKVLSGVTA